MKNFAKRSFALALMCVMTAGSGLNVITADATTGEYKSWKQGDSRWGSTYLGSSGETLSRIGCAVTSVAMLMVHSGSMSDENFDPGILCDYLSSNGGFDGYGNIKWGKATGLENSFQYQGGGTLSGSQSAKSSEIASYLDSGYYAAVSVNYGGHWVAVDYVDNNETVYMIDPAKGTNADLFSVYSADGVGQIRLFRGANSPAIKKPVSEESASDVSETKNTEQNSYKEGRYTNTDVLNIRKDAGTENPVIKQLPKNTSVFVYEVSDSWGKISYDGTEGWISLKYTNYGGVVPFFTTGLYKTLSDLNLRENADIDSKSKLVIPVSTSVNVVQINENWGKVEYNGTEGWICMDYTSCDNNSQPDKTTDKAEKEESENIQQNNERLGEYLTFDEVKFKDGAGAEYKQLGKIPGYARLNITEISDNNWGKTTFNGMEGWICLDYAKLCSHTVEEGDVNGDGFITINDVFLLRQEIAKMRDFTPAEIAVSDINKDGIVDETDVELIRKKIN